MRLMTSKFGRPGCLVALVAGLEIEVAGCGGSGAPPAAGSPTVASLSTTRSVWTGRGHSSGVTTTTPPTDNATVLVDAWAAGMRSHGDPDQADPTIDANKDVNISWSPAITGGILRTYKTGAHVPGAGGPPPPRTIRLDGAGPFPNAVAGSNG